MTMSSLYNLWKDVSRKITRQATLKWTAVSRKFAQRTIDATPLQLKDPEGWATFFAGINGDERQEAIRHVAERWAKLMQHDVDKKGRTLGQVAEKTYLLANDQELTGYMYGDVIFILCTTWKYGEQLRKWHNPQFDLTGEADRGGVKNPSSLICGSPTRGVDTKNPDASRTPDPA